MVNNQVGRPGDEPDRETQTRGIPESGSDVDEVRNEVPTSSGQPASRPLESPDQPPTRASQAPPPPEPSAATGGSVRGSGMGPGEEVRFDRSSMMDRDEDNMRPAKAGFVGMGMNLTAVIILIIAVIVILWFVL